MTFHRKGEGPPFHSNREGGESIRCGGSVFGFKAYQTSSLGEGNVIFSESEKISEEHREGLSKTAREEKGQHTRETDCLAVLTMHVRLEIKFSRDLVCMPHAYSSSSWQPRCTHKEC